MNKEEYYARMKKIQNKLSTDRCSLDEEHNLIVQKCYLKDKYIETCEQQLSQLTNNWNELEEWVKSHLDDEFYWFKFYDKMQIIKEKNNE